jgi:hypothetical protein
MSDVRDRLRAYAGWRDHSTNPCDEVTKLTANAILGNLDYLDIAVADAREGEAEINEALIAMRVGMPEGREAAVDAHDARMRAFVAVQYRIDTFFVWARVLLDDIGALVGRALAPTGASFEGHQALIKNLGKAVEGRGLVGADDVEQQARKFAAVRQFRNDHVIHRTRPANRLYTNRALQVDADGSVQINIGSTRSAETGKVPLSESGSAAAVFRQLETYLEAVLDLIEQLPPLGDRDEDSPPTPGRGRRAPPSGQNF